MSDQLGTHECPFPGCDRTVRDDLFACPPHWHSLPGSIRGAIYSGFRKGVGSNRHASACRRAAAYWASLRVGVAS